MKANKETETKKLELKMKTENEIKVGDKVLWSKDVQETRVIWRIIRVDGSVVNFRDNGFVRIAVDGKNITMVVRLSDLVLIHTI